MMNQLESTIWNTVQAINRCWTCGDLSELEKLNAYFHDSMVAITPTDKLRLDGKRACFEGWAGFCRQAKIICWKETDPKIQVYGDTAVVTYYYHLSLEIEGRNMDMSGRDMLVLIKENDKWRVVADQFSPFPQP
jgi:ketosteroid isomerase-like protein